MDFKFEKRKTKKDKERRNQIYNGKYSQKHIRIQEQNQKKEVVVFILVNIFLFLSNSLPI